MESLKSIGRRKFLARSFGALSAMALTGSVRAKENRKPNILFFLADDQRNDFLHRGGGHVVLNFEEVNYLPVSCFKRLDELRSKIEKDGHHMAIVSTATSMRALMSQDTPDLVATLAETEKKAIALVSRSE